MKSYWSRVCPESSVTGILIKECHVKRQIYTQRDEGGDLSLYKPRAVTIFIKPPEAG